MPFTLTTTIFDNFNFEPAVIVLLDQTKVRTGVVEEPGLLAAGVVVVEEPELLAAGVVVVEEPELLAVFVKYTV